MDLIWLVIPAAVGLFVLRTWLIARKLKLASETPWLADARALREAKDGLRAHRDRLEEAVAASKEHLKAAKALRRVAIPPRRPVKGVDAMVKDFLPERRL